MDIGELARKYALKNAVDYGKAIPGPIVSKLMAASKGQKDMKEIAKAASDAAAWANALGKDDLQKEYAKYSVEFDAEKKVKTEKTAKPKMELEGATTGTFVTRFPPEPSGYMHIGHAKVAILEQEFKKIYNGKLLLYWDDSNPEKEKQEFVDAFKKDLDWLGIKFDKEAYASDNIPKVYDYARQMILGGKAYACSCDSEQLKEGRMKGKGCEHRLGTPEDSLKAFESMLKGELAEGDAIIRFKGDMKSPNTTLRDPTLMRIKKEKHYRQGTKYTVWPLYDLNTPINDFLNGVTDVIRDKNYELRDALYMAILDSLGLGKPRIHPEARLVIDNNITSKRDLNILFKEGKITGYDDPRLITIAALKRRGVKPAAIREFVMRFGMSRSESHVDISMLMDENKKLIDADAKRLYFVESPVKVTVEDATRQKIEIKLHPTANMGSRSYTVDGTFYVSKQDADTLQMGMVFKPKGLYGVRVTKYESGTIVGTKIEEDSKLKVQWVNEKNRTDCEILVPKPPLKEDGEFDTASLVTVKGYAEDYALKLKEGEIIQFERFGFCILDDKKRMSFIFMSK